MKQLYYAPVAQPALTDRFSVLQIHALFIIISLWKSAKWQ